jgi:hypothetical protein
MASHLHSEWPWSASSSPNEHRFNLADKRGKSNTRRRSTADVRLGDLPCKTGREISSRKERAMRLAVLSAQADTFAGANVKEKADSSLRAE